MIQRHQVYTDLDMPHDPVLMRPLEKGREGRPRWLILTNRIVQFYTPLATVWPQPQNGI